MSQGGLHINFSLTECEKEIQKIWADIKLLKDLIYDIQPGLCCVVSVNGKDGVVVLTTSDIAEGSNKYYTNSRVQAFADTRYALLGHKHPLSDIIDFPSQTGQAGKFLTTNGVTPFWAPVPTGYTDEQAQDAVASMIAAGSHTGITFTYNDTLNKLSATVTAVGGSIDEEQVRDIIFATFQDSTSIDFTTNDSADTVTAAVRIPFVRGLFGGANGIGYNSTVGVFGLLPTGVAAGTYSHPTVTVDSFGRILTIASGTAPNNYPTNLSFNLLNGNLSLDRNGLGTLVTNLDGRYALNGVAKEIVFVVGNVGVPNGGDTTFILEDCDGNPVLNSKIDFFLERSLLIENRDYTYNIATGAIILTNPLLAGQWAVIKIWPKSLWQVCTTGTVPVGDFLLINDTDPLLVTDIDPFLL